MRASFLVRVDTLDLNYLDVQHERTDPWLQTGYHGPMQSAGRWKVRILAAMVLALIAHAIQAQAPARGPLLEPPALAAAAKEPNVRVIDIRDGQDAQGKTPYDHGHIPGAVHAPYRFWRGPETAPGRMRDQDYLGELVQRLGVERDTLAVVVFEGRDSSDFGAAARVYWTLRYIGVEHTAILNGGMRAWRAAGQPVDSADVKIIVSDFDPDPQAQILATREQVQKSLGQPRVSLLDGRPEPFFRGDMWLPIAKRAGTITGATNLDSDVWFRDGSAVMLPPDALRALAAKHGLRNEDTTLSFCNTGHWAATNWFVLAEMLGYKDVRLYPDSVVDWSATNLPMDNVPARGKQLWLQLKAAFGN
jgi:thiosulfate/3-mercaptopyruvate sulfurtransferase